MRPPRCSSAASSRRPSCTLPAAATAPRFCGTCARAGSAQPPSTLVLVGRVCWSTLTSRTASEPKSARRADSTGRRPRQCSPAPPPSSPRCSPSPSRCPRRTASTASGAYSCADCAGFSSTRSASPRTSRPCLCSNRRCSTSPGGGWLSRSWVRGCSCTRSAAASSTCAGRPPSCRPLRAASALGRHGAADAQCSRCTEDAWGQRERLGSLRRC
mmetsp:Transcript_35002/g.80938  ORF Transcript_35002/g.80938 Transcript_35002/m.80938 type:complete len:214 (-) Transcript_35002:255-896(-)